MCQTEQWLNYRFSNSFYLIVVVSASPKQNLSPDKVYHIVVAPCFDKKLEAIREEFCNTLLDSRDVDCVLTSGLVFYTAAVTSLWLVTSFGNKSI